MHLHTRNVNTAFRTLVKIFSGKAGDGDPPVSRRPYSNPNGSGHVLTIEEPVTITYSHPRERVLFNAARDANPFFHLYEALWMLAGRNDVAPLAYYNSRITQYSDDGKTFNGAYGYRWRKAAGGMYGSGPTMVRVDDPNDPSGKRTELADLRVGTTNQLDILVNHLKACPESRRAVLTMWNVEDDLLKIGPFEFDPESAISPNTAPHPSASKDVCCNLDVMFSLREAYPGKAHDGHYYLDMTVTNRSNDLVWGCLGADYTTFSFLQEYVAVRLGAEVGRYHHFSNNLHVYDDRKDWRPEELLNSPAADENIYDVFKTVPLVKDPTAFERELPRFVEENSRNPTNGAGGWTEPFLADVAQPALHAFHLHKRGGEWNDRHKFGFCERIAADDWRVACARWLERRAK
jgi:thymidylate synthase